MSSILLDSIRALQAMNKRTFENLRMGMGAQLAGTLNYRRKLDEELEVAASASPAFRTPARPSAGERSREWPLGAILDTSPNPDHFRALESSDGDSSQRGFPTDLELECVGLVRVDICHRQERRIAVLQQEIELARLVHLEDQRNACALSRSGEREGTVTQMAITPMVSGQVEDLPNIKNGSTIIISSTESSMAASMDSSPSPELLSLLTRPSHALPAVIAAPPVLGTSLGFQVTLPTVFPPPHTAVEGGRGATTLPPFNLAEFMRMSSGIVEVDVDEDGDVLAAGEEESRTTLYGVIDEIIHQNTEPIGAYVELPLQASTPVGLDQHFDL